MGYRVLVVDDSPMYRILLQEMFELLGHQVVGEADCAAAALREYQKLKPDLITLDISLPDSDGLSVLKELRQMDPAVNALVISGNDQDKILARARDLGALDILDKPFKKEKLASVLEKLASRIK